MTTEANPSSERIWVTEEHINKGYEDCISTPVALALRPILAKRGYIIEAVGPGCTYTKRELIKEIYFTHGAMLKEWLNEYSKSKGQYKPFPLTISYKMKFIDIL